MKNHFVYVLQSLGTVRFYVGSTQDLQERLKKHNFGAVRSTKKWRPWKLVYFEAFNNRTDAVRREFQIKRYKGGNSFKALLKRGVAQ